jgi:hypothetical protein
MSIERDPIEILVRAKEKGEPLPFEWVVEWSVGGQDPVVAVWRLSRNPYWMVQLAARTTPHREVLRAVVKSLRLVSLPPDLATIVDRIAIARGSPKWAMSTGSRLNKNRDSTRLALVVRDMLYALAHLRTDRFIDHAGDAVIGIHESLEFRHHHDRIESREIVARRLRAHLHAPTLAQVEAAKWR